MPRYWMPAVYARRSKEYKIAPKTNFKSPFIPKYLTKELIHFTHLHLHITIVSMMRSGGRVNRKKKFLKSFSPPKIGTFGEINAVLTTRQIEKIHTS